MISNPRLLNRHVFINFIIFWFFYRIKIDTLLWIISIKVEDVGVNDSFSSLPYLSSFNIYCYIDSN